MQRTLYIRPVGLYPVPEGEGEVWGGLQVAGLPLAFSAVEVIERRGKSAERRIIGIGEFMERDWGRQTLAASDMFDSILTPRPRLAGLDLSRPRIMGIVNVTPDSFSDGGHHHAAEQAIAHALRLADEGADILDIGGESTRPGSDPVSLEEELARVMPVIEALAGKVEARLSIDTRKAEVMRRAHAAGIDMINDVSALMYDPRALDAAAETGLPVCLMHAQGDPKTMQDEPRYDDALTDVFDFLEARVEAALRAGIRRDRLMIDPGIGFGKTVAHNLQLMAGLSLFHALGVPLVLGASRKRFIGAITGEAVAGERVVGSVAAALAGVAQGAHIIRVHDVKATRQGLDVWMATQSGSAPDA